MKNQYTTLQCLSSQCINVNHFENVSLNRSEQCRCYELNTCYVLIIFIRLSDQKISDFCKFSRPSYNWRKWVAKQHGAQTQSIEDANCILFYFILRNQIKNPQTIDEKWGISTCWNHNNRFYFRMGKSDIIQASLASCQFSVLVKYFNVNQMLERHNCAFLLCIHSNTTGVGMYISVTWKKGYIVSFSFRNSGSKKN